MNDVTEALIEAVADACERYPSTTEAGGDTVWNLALWGALDQIGVTLLSVPETTGGSGGDLQMAVAVLEVLGQHSAAVPYAETALQAAWMLAECGGPIPPGPLAAAVAGSAVSMVENSDSWVLNGTLRRVPWARHAEHIIVLIGGRIVTIRRGDVTIAQGTNMAGEPRDDVLLQHITVAADCVRDVPEASVVSESTFNARGALARAAMIAGAARRALELSVQYAAQRQQFGRTVNAFQAVQQQMASMAGEVLLCKIAAGAAALSLDTDSAGTVAVAAAKTSTAQSAGTVARIAHQVHGAIGFTDEHLLRLSTTRLWAWREEAGSETQWARELGALSLATGADGLWPALVD
ncbi:acyl-CoA dehydrogenase family protein [Pseudarthrobacter sulfonivorans]|uniref:acyl-CoA dehydrogenase family protein n=1 Tax=Pseudarthrobacter sulfonivorans TaxID=121292 RepID=UPI00168A78D7|nr:acyl-CoA dehydrogenase family protein [Pseudarthrobacter sulfonivorans]